MTPQEPSVEMWQKPTNRGRGRKNNSTPHGGPGPGKPQAAQGPKLELPDGYVPQGKQVRNNGWNKTASYSSDFSFGLLSPNMSQSFRAVKPWALDQRYPRPSNDKSLLSFNYDRQWHSFEGKDVMAELNKALARGRRAKLPPIFGDSSPEALQKAEKEYRRRGHSNLYKARMAIRNTPQSSKLLIASPKASATKPDPNENEGLVKFLQIAELRAILIDFLIPSVGDLTALAATCRGIAALVPHSFEIWDFNSGAFPTGRFVNGDGIRSSTLIVTPISDEPECPKKPYMKDFRNLVDLCAAITTIPHTSRSIILDQIPFLDVRLFELMVNSMPNLTTVIITRCLLLDVSKLKPLLKVIERHPRSVEDEDKQLRRQYIRLDFFPYFFRGPQTSTRLGSYGVTYNEPTFHTPKAVFGLILQCWDLARLVGMDLVSDSSSFWSFVRQLPGPDVLWAIKARDALLSRERERELTKRATEAVQDTVMQNFADDITAALTGDDFRPGDHRIPYHQRKFRGKDHHAMNYWRRSESCVKCGFTYPWSLFPSRLGACWSCHMSRYVDEMECSHLRLFQLSAMNRWMFRLDPARSTLDDLLKYRECTLDAALLDVRCADWAWEYFLSFRPQPGNAQYTPPESDGFDNSIRSMARWRWSRQPPTGPFDYRKGGPQYEDPCKKELDVSIYQDIKQGPEPQEMFNLRWRWTWRTDIYYLEAWRARSADPKDEMHRFHLFDELSFLQHLSRARVSPEEWPLAMDIEWRAQNEFDKKTYTEHNAHVEDDLASLYTPGSKPFNLDKPVIHKSVNPHEYRAFIEEASRAWLPHTSVRKCSYW